MTTVPYESEIPGTWASSSRPSRDSRLNRARRRLGERSSGRVREAFGAAAAERLKSTGNLPGSRGARVGEHPGSDDRPTRPIQVKTRLVLCTCGRGNAPRDREGEGPLEHRILTGG